MYAWVKKKEGNSKKDPRVKNRKSPKKEYNIPKIRKQSQWQSQLQ